MPRSDLDPHLTWPLPNVHLGVSVEDQATADERIPLLLETPAAVRWISAEPLLGPVDLHKRECLIDKRRFRYTIGRYLDWVVVGGESGSRARPCNVEWIRSIIDQCRSTNVPVWVKQLGANPWAVQSRCEEPANHWIHKIRHRAGEDMAEWPEDLRVRELPR